MTEETSHYVDAMAYYVAAQFAKLQDDYFFLHVKPAPWWMPAFVWKWLVGKMLVMTRFNSSAKRPKTTKQLNN